VYSVINITTGFIKTVHSVQLNPLKPKRERERVKKDSRRVKVKRKQLRKSERRFISGEKKDHLVRRYPGNARLSF
jgi:hypothetical protein